MKTQIKQLINSAHEQHFRRSLQTRDKWMVESLNLPPFSKQELCQINDTWPWIKQDNDDLIWSRVYKKFHGFNPYFITDWQLHHILKQTNPYKQVVSLQNKAMVDVYFPEIPFPHNYLKNIRGVFWCEGEMKELETAVDYIIKNEINQFVIKPSVESGCGKGVRLVDLNSESDKLAFLRELFNSYNKDFVVQEVLKQHPIIHQLNPTSINSCRVTSLFINGVFSYSSILKVGKKGSNVDNWHSSYLIGMDENGNILDKGYDNKLNQVTITDNGIAFAGLAMPYYKELISSIKKWHIAYFPNIGIIGWDVIVDQNNQTKVIEINTDAPGVVGEQFCSGTFFKIYKECINSIFNKKTLKS